jgi:hypothetical protein
LHVSIVLNAQASLRTCCALHRLHHLLITAHCLVPVSYYLHMEIPTLNSLVSSARSPAVVYASGRTSGCTWCSISYARSVHSIDTAYRLVRTRSFACMRRGPICPFLALFLMSATSFFSWFSSLTRSRSSSRCVFSSARWCFLSLSAGVIRLPKAHSTIFMVAMEVEDRVLVEQC